MIASEVRQKRQFFSNSAAIGSPNSRVAVGEVIQMVASPRSVIHSLEEKISSPSLFYAPWTHHFSP